MLRRENSSSRPRRLACQDIFVPRRIAYCLFTIAVIDELIAELFRRFVWTRHNEYIEKRDVTLKRIVR